jgi:general nucleoside transport system permease protein
MTVTAASIPPTLSPLGTRPRVSPAARAALFALTGFVVFSLCQQFTRQPDLTKASTFSAAVSATLPIMLVGLGGLLSERSGVVNIGLEGMMICGTWGAGFFGYHFGPWAALLGGMFCGAVGGALHALATVTFGVDHVVSGVAVNLLAIGWASFLSASLFKGRGSGSETNSPGFNPTDGMPTVRLPGFGAKGWLSDIEDKDWPVVSDVAALVRGLFGNVPMYQIVAVLCIAVVTYLVWRTPFGLRLRSSGEKPSAADSLGVNVNRIRYQAVMLSGAFAGLGGAMLVLNLNGQYSEGQTNGRGYTGLAALIFGNWRPSGVVAGSGLFGYLSVLEDTSEPRAVRGLYLFLVVGLVVTAVWLFRKNQMRPAVGSLIAAVILFVWFGPLDGAIQKDFYNALPAIGTILVLVIFSRRLRPPAAAGLPWRKGQIT